MHLCFTPFLSIGICSHLWGDVCIHNTGDASIWDGEREVNNNKKVFFRFVPLFYVSNNRNTALPSCQFHQLGPLNCTTKQWPTITEITNQYNFNGRTYTLLSSFEVIKKTYDLLSSSTNQFKRLSTLIISVHYSSNILHCILFCAGEGVPLAHITKWRHRRLANGSTDKVKIFYNIISIRMVSKWIWL